MLRRRPQPTKRSFASFLWNVAKLVVIVGILCAVGYHFFCDYVQKSIRGQLLAKLNEVLPDSIQADIQSATFVEGAGFKVDHLTLTSNAASESPELLRIESAFIQIPVSTPELVAGNTKPTAIKVKRARIFLERNSDGKWNFEPLLGCFQQDQQLGCDTIPVDLLDCQLTLLDHSQAVPRKLELQKINLHLREQCQADQKYLRLVGSLSGIAVDEIGFQAFLDPVTKQWATEFHAKQARISQDLFKLLPDSLQETTNQTEFLNGTINVHARVDGNLNGTTPMIELDGEIRDFAIKHPDVPFVLSQTNVDFQFKNEELTVSRADGVLDEGRFEARYHQVGLIDRRSWEADGFIKDFRFRRELASLLPNGCDKFCDDFEPNGVSDIHFQFAHDGEELRKRLDAKIKDMSFSFIKVPYLVEHCHGTVKWINDLCQFRLTANDRGQEILISGAVNRPGKKSTFKIDLELNGSLPIDEKMLRSINKMPKLEEAVLACRPSGRISGKATFTKSLPNGKPKQDLTIELQQCHARHKSFNYPIHNIKGTVKFRGGKTYFERITGSSGVAQIECNGTFDESYGLVLNFISNQVPLDEQLRQAIPANIRDIWNGFRPNGEVALLRVNLTKKPGQPIDITVNADLGKDSTIARRESSSVSIYPKWFPYAIKNLSGQVYVGDGQIRLSEMNGFHDRTRMAWNGTGTYSPKSWSLLLQQMLVGSVKVNEELLQALPRSLAPAIRQLNYQGALSVAGDIQLNGDVIESKKQDIGLVSYESYYDANGKSSAPPEYPPDQFWNTTMAWDLRFDLDQAKMMVGLPVENVFGKIELQGRYDGQRAICRGQLAIDSMTWYDAQIANITGPIWIDESQILAGSYVTTSQSDRPVTPLTGKLFGGTVRLDAQKQLQGKGPYFIQASLVQGKLSEAVEEYAPQLEQVKGQAFTAIRFQGDDSGPRSYRGRGTLQLRNAEIYQLPVMIALLKIPHFKNLNRTAFDMSNVDFDINKDGFLLRRIELIGDAISLIGNGDVGFDKDINLNFYTVMGRGRLYIPIISELYRAGSKRILWIKVDGTLNDPKASRELLPQLNDSIKQLFEPVPGTGSSTPDDLIIDIPGQNR